MTFARRIDAVALLAEGSDLLGRIYTRLDDRRQAHSSWTQAIHAFERIGDHARVTEIRALLNGDQPDEPRPTDPDDDTHAGWF